MFYKKKNIRKKNIYILLYLFKKKKEYIFFTQLYKNLTRCLFSLFLLSPATPNSHTTCRNPQSIHQNGKAIDVKCIYKKETEKTPIITVLLTRQNHYKKKKVHQQKKNH